MRTVAHTMTRWRHRLVTFWREPVVTLAGESRYRFSATPPGFPHYVTSALDGEASFEITPTEGVVEIVTSRATIHLDAGREARAHQR